MHRLVGILLTVTSVAGAYPQASNDSRQADIYAIYSSLMSNPPVGSQNPVYAIVALTRPAMAPTTTTMGAAMGQPCITPRPEQAARWIEILADYHERIDKPPTLVRQLNIAKPYFLISQEEAAAFGAAHRENRPPPKVPPPPAPPLDPKFNGVTSIFALSDVWFSKDGTLALTGITDFSFSRWRLFEKNADGKWVNVFPASECIQMA